MKDLEGLKLVLDWHGNNNYNITLFGSDINQLKSTLEMVQEFLKEHKDAKVYIENEACFGADNLKVFDYGETIYQGNLWNLVMKEANYYYKKKIRENDDCCIIY